MWLAPDDPVVTQLGPDISHGVPSWGKSNLSLGVALSRLPRAQTSFQLLGFLLKHAMLAGFDHNILGGFWGDHMIGT